MQTIEIWNWKYNWVIEPLVRLRTKGAYWVLILERFERLSNL